MWAGMLLIVAALLLVMYNIWEEQQVARDSRIVLQDIKTYITDGDKEQPMPGQNQGTEMPVCTVNGIEYIGTLEIPALSRVLPVIAEWNNSNLKKEICRYKGSPYTGDFIIAGHNYRTHFGNLSKLAVDDYVKFTDVNGLQFSYKVLEFEKMPQTAVEHMEEGDWDLTIFTCDYSGRNRVAVRCIRAD